MVTTAEILFLPAVLMLAVVTLGAGFIGIRIFPNFVKEIDLFVRLIFLLLQVSTIIFAFVMLSEA